MPTKHSFLKTTRSAEQRSERQSTKMRLEPRHWLSLIIPSWGELRLVNVAREASPPSTGLYLGSVHWLRKSEAVILEDLPAMTGTERKALLRTVRKLRNVKHPNVMSVLGISHSTHGAFVVTAHVEQNCLLPSLRGTSSVDRRHIATQIADGLRFLHQLGVVHGRVNSNNVVMMASDVPVLIGFASSLARSPRVSTSFFSWGDDSPLADRNRKFEIPKDTDAPAEVITRYPRPPIAGDYFPDDTAVSADMKSKVIEQLQSNNKAEDLFALAFLVMEVFTELAPNNSLRTLQSLRIVLNHQHPSHPGRTAALRGLDRVFWSFCLSCWNVGDNISAPLNQMVDKLTARRSDIVRSPFEQSVSWIEERVKAIPHLDGQIHDMRDVKDGRDAEMQLYEVKGTWRRKNGSSELVKIITPTLCRRGSLRRQNDFKAEAFVWSQLRHPSVLPLLGIVVHEDTNCFVVPWMAGGTCVDYLRTHPEVDVLSLLVHIAEGLHYLHTRAPAVVHGYLRASSVLVSETGTPFIANFDFTPLQRDRDFDDSRFDYAGRWSAPEFCCSKHTTKSDIFSFAMLAYELYSGKVPYYDIPERAVTDMGSMSVSHAIDIGIRPERPANATLDDGVWGIVERCWVESPASRPSMGTVARELRQLRA